MKTFFTISFLVISLLGFVSCQTKPIKIIFVSTQNDSATALNEIKAYKLKKKTINSDFNYAKLNDIDGNIKDTLNTKNLMPIFEPVSGEFTYYQLLSTFKGWGYHGDGPSTIEDFHNILIIKTDSENKILDAYQYTLEWAEPPLQFDLYKSDVKNLVLKNGLDISSLKLERKDYWDKKDRVLKESGRIKLD